jgi:hypothetical protein
MRLIGQRLLTPLALRFCVTCARAIQLGVPLRVLFRALDNDCDGRIDGLELMGGLALCCRGTFEVRL